MNLLDYYNIKNSDKKSLRAQGGLTYIMISEFTHGQVSPTEAFHAVKNPWRVTYKKYKAVADVLGMPTAEAIDEWALAKADHAKRLAAKQLPARITAARKARR